MTPATVVDHIQTIASAPELRLVASNHRSLCKPCHDSHTASTVGFGRSAPRKVIGCDVDGYPLLSPRLTLIDCSLSEEEIKMRHPSFWKYLENGKTTGIHETYLASKRRPWYSQEKRPPPPFVCTYMGRTRNGKKPFRVIWNKSNATAANVYLLLYPKPALAAALSAEPELYSMVFDHLRSIEADTFVDEGRVYGGGLHKMEPKELERVPLQGLADMLNASNAYKGQMALLFDAN